MNLLIGTKIAKELENKNTSLIIPDFKDNNNIIEVMTLLEAQINILIDDMKSNIEKEAEIAINDLIKEIPILIKDKDKEEIKSLEYEKIRNIQNSYRFIVAELDKNKARCLDIAHEIFESQSNHSEKKNKQKPGRPKKIENDQINQEDISNYFVREN